MPIILLMSSKYFIFFVLLLAVANLEVYRHFQFYFSGVDRLNAQVSALRAELKSQKVQTQLATYQLDDFKQNVAVLMPEVLKKQKSVEQGYSLRNLASLVTSPLLDGPQIERASSLFEKGRELFRGTAFEKSNDVFAKLISKYPSSVHAIESHFLLVEGMFQIHDYEKCVGIVDAMVTNYPESELTGFALLRLGKLFEFQDRFEDAVEVYKTVIKTYHDKDLLKQASVFLKTVEI